MAVPQEQGQSHDGERWLLAIDGGGSKVAGRLVRATRDMNGASSQQSFEFTKAGVGSAALNHWHAAIENIADVTGKLCEQAAIDASCITATTLMLAGAGRADDLERVQHSLREHPTLRGLREVEVTTDIHPLLKFAQTLSPKLPSIVVIVGTGSLVAAYDSSGSFVRAGGWGPMLGDAGSGWGIAQAALRFTCDWVDQTGSRITNPNGTDPVIVSAVKNYLLEKHLVAPESESLASGLIQLAGDRQLAAQLGPAIIDLTEHDPQSLAIVTQQVKSLVQQIANVHSRLAITGREWRLCLTGGLARNNARIRTLISERLAEVDKSPSDTLLIVPLEAATATML